MSGTGAVWLAVVNEAEITATEAMGYFNLGQPAHAEALFRAALADELPPRNRALYAAQLAVAILAQGRLDEAIAVGSAVLTAVEEGISSVRVLEELRPIHDAAKAVAAAGQGAVNGHKAEIAHVAAAGGSGEKRCHLPAIELTGS